LILIHAEKFAVIWHGCGTGVRVGNDAGKEQFSTFHIPPQRGKADASHRALMMNCYNFPDKLYDFSLPSRLVVVIGEP
jgi:hypothetical protein